MEPEVKELLKQAKELAASKNYEQLLINAKEIVRLDKKSYTGYIFYGLAAAHLTQRDLSEKAYRRAIELNPTQATAHQGLVELFTMSGDYAKLADALTELLALLKSDHPKYVEYLLKRATALQAQPAKMQLAAAAWQILSAHPGADEHRLLAKKHLYEIAVAAEKAELQAETEQRFQARVKKTPLAEQDQLRLTIEKEVRLALYARPDLDKQLQQLMELSNTSEFHVKAIQRLQTKLPVVPPAARPELRAAIRGILASATNRQPSFFALETLLGFVEEEHFLNETASVPALSPNATRFYKLLMHSHPDRPLSSIGFAHQFLQQGKSEDALALLELSLRRVPQSLQGWVALGHAQLDASLYLAALDTVAKLKTELQKRSADAPALPAVYTAADLIWARANHRGLGRKEEARATYSAILARIPEHVEALRGLAQIASDFNELDTALSYYAKLIALRPNDADAVAESGSLLLRANKLSDAIERLQQALAIKPTAPMAHHWLGVACWKSGGALRIEKAKTELLLSAQQRPDFATNYTYLGHYYREVDKDEARARRCYQKAITLDAQENDAGIALADMYLAAGQETLAVALYKELTGRSTRVLWAWLRQAVVQERDSEHEEAATSFQAALRLDASSVVCWRGLAEAYRKQGKYMASLKAFSRLLELDPKSSYGRYQVAAIELLLGLRAKSLAAFEGLLSETPDYVPALKGAGEAQLAIAREQYSQGFGERAVLSAERATTFLASCTKQQANLRSVWKAYGDALVLRAQLTRQVKNVAGKEVEYLKAAINAYEIAHGLEKKITPSLLQDLAVARYKLAVVLQRQGSAKEAGALLARAEAEVSEALKVDPASASLWRTLAIVSTKSALRQHAFLAAIEANEISGGAWADLGHFYLMQGAEDLALRAYAEAQLLEPHAPGGWLGQALVEELIANRQLSSANPEVELKRAKAAYDQAMQTLPTAMACIGAAHTSLACNDFDSAATAVRRYMQLEGCDTHALNLLGLVLEAQGLYTAAVASFTDGIRLLESAQLKPEPALPHAATLSITAGGVSSASEAVMCANLGRALYFARKPADAIAALLKADQMSRTNVLFLAAAQAMSGAHAEAMKTAEKALAIAGSTDDTKSLQALVVRLWQAQDSTPKALTAAAKFAEETPSLWQLFYAVASHASDAKAVRLAQPHLPNSGESGVLKGAHSRIEADASRARSALLSALHAHPNDRRLWRHLAGLTLDSVAAPSSALAALTSNLVPRCTSLEDFQLQAALYLTQGKTSRSGAAALLRNACAAAQRCLRISPLDPTALYLLAASAYSLARRSKRQDQWRRAEQAVRLALAALSAADLARTRSALLAAQADCLLFLGKLDDATVIANQIACGAKSGQLYAASMVQQARCKAAARDVAAAVAFYKTAIKDSPTATRWTELAALYEYTSQWAPAELCHRQAIVACPTTSPRRLATMLRLGHHYIARHRWDDAQAALAEAALLNDLHPTLLLLQGFVLAKSNSAADAEWCMQAATAQEPSMPLASLLLSELHLAGGNAAAAESDAFYERDTSPESDAALWQLAKVAVASKQTESATSYLLRAIHMNPSRGDYWAELQKLKQQQKPAAIAKK